MEAVLKADLSHVRPPSGGERVYKDECIYSFQTPENEGGLYVSLSSFVGLGPEHLALHHRKTGESLYLHITRTEKPPAPKPEGEAPPAKKPTRLAIGVEGGFDGGAEPEREWVESHKVVVMPTRAAVPFPNPELPQKVVESVEGVLAAQTASKTDAILSWEGDKRKISTYAENLEQLQNGVRIPPSGWKCQKCDLTTNLWLNLTDGAILCGRKYFDGSGGNNHAVEHYDRLRYPLAVKLGTITPSGADVYCYAEDDMVEDPKLAQHLEHFGINITSMTKTDVTMTELEIEANIKFSEWSIIQEAGKELVPCYGPGYTGLENLGNSCYLNSVVQVFLSLDEFRERYYVRSEEIFSEGPAAAHSDFNMQMCKLSVGLLSGRHSKPKTAVSAETTDVDNKQSKSQRGIRPAMFKSLVGKGHSEFSSTRQQDASEFLLHLLSLLERSERASSGSHSHSLMSLFQFQVEERIQCMESGQVRYIQKEETIWRLPVAIETATNKDEYEEWQKKKAELRAAKERVKPEDEVRAKVPFAECQKKFEFAVEINGFYSSAVKKIALANKKTRFATFPDYLILQMNRFYVNDDWTPQKYDVEIVGLPEELDLTSLRGCGLQPNEVELPEGDAPPPANQNPVAVEIDEGVVLQLVSMGFDVEGCKRAVFTTKNQGVEPAMNWILEHMSDPDFATPFVPPQSNTPATTVSSGPDEGAVAMVMSLGFTREHAMKALKETGNDVERAADWVFSHAHELDAMETDETTPTTNTQTKCPDGPGKYQLHAFISHMGASTLCGHYVCHIKKEGRWVIFNDEKVAESAAPPIGHAYLYIYKRAAAEN